MKVNYIAITVSVLVTCCAQPEQQAIEGQPGSKQEIFPVGSFIEGQVHLVDSLRLPVLKYTTVNNITDSALISQEEFESLTKEFTQPDLADPSLKDAYTENSFADQSIPSVTITYLANNRNMAVQRVDVLIDPNPVMNDKVKSIYMEKVSAHKDTSILKKLFWKADKEFQIVTSSQAGDQTATVKQLKVRWGNTD